MVIDEDFSFELTSQSMISDFSTNGKLTEIIIVLPSQENIFSYSGNFEIEEIMIVNSHSEIDIILPTEIVLGEAYPNPFNPVTNLDISVTEESFVTVKIYDIRGYGVNTLLSANLERGTHTVSWNASDFPSGLYIVRAETSNGIQSQKITLLK